MKVMVYWVVAALIYVPLCVWLQPPWYACVAIGTATGLLVDLWVESWWIERGWR